MMIDILNVFGFHERLIEWKVFYFKKVTRF